MWVNPLVSNRTIVSSFLAAAALLALTACNQPQAEETEVEPVPQATTEVDLPPTEATAPSPSNGNKASDPEDDLITAAVIEVLSINPTIERYEILVQSNDGVVTLGGAVDSAEEKQQAEELAQEVEGVQEVENNIVVSEEASRFNNEG